MSISQVPIRELFYLAAVSNKHDDDSIWTVLLTPNNDPRIALRYNQHQGRLPPSTKRGAETSAATRALYWATRYVDPTTPADMVFTLPSEPLLDENQFPLLRLRMPFYTSVNPAWTELMKLVSQPVAP